MPPRVVAGGTGPRVEDRDPGRRDQERQDQLDLGHPGACTPTPRSAATVRAVVSKLKRAATH
jgi:hypothetical protein